MRKCRFCGKLIKRPIKGYCVSCYQYFIMHKYDTWCPSKYGELNRVEQKESPQYNWPVCHICGKAFAKLQQHIWYAHNMTKNEYCDTYGLDHNINMTSTEYHEKMRQYAYDNNMDDQLRKIGKNTQFTKGRSNTYERSYQTKQRLREHGIKIGNKYKCDKGNDINEEEN